MDTIYMIIQLTLASAIPLLVVSLGGLITEKSGVTNIGLEGMMIFGAFVGVWFLSAVEGSSASNILFVLAMLIGGIAGGLLSIVHAYAAIKMKADQTISATAINLFSPAFAVFVLMVVNNNSQQINLINNYQIDAVPLLSKIPLIGPMFFERTYISAFLGIVLLVVITIFLNKTKLGLRLSACGENPSAADAAGVNVFKIRYGAVITSGILAGIGGVMFAVSTSSMFDPGAGVAGFGFLAIAVVIFGNWKPIRILYVALFFGLMRVLGAIGNNLPVLENLRIPDQIYRMLPYIATLIVLMVTSKNTRAPKAVGQIYDVGKR